MRFRDVLGRLTGISTPVFGVSWNPPQSERDIASNVLTFLEDRRVLYNPSVVEIPEHCVESVVEIRHELTRFIQAGGRDGELGGHLQAMRAACRKFMTSVGDVRQPTQQLWSLGNYQGWVFLSALGELRGVFGVHVAQLAAKYGLDVGRELATILPGKDSDSKDDTGDHWPEVH